MAISTIGQEGLSSSAQYIGFKNRIINGDMRIDQRNAGASVTAGNGSTAGSYVPFPVDRMRTQSFSTTAGNGAAFTAQQLSTGSLPPGFKNYIGVTVTSTQSILQSSSLYRLIHRIEGYNVADFKWGTSDASPITLSFWVRSSIAGVYSGAVTNAGGNVSSWMSYSFNFTINTANAWEYKTISIPGATGGTWITDSGPGLELSITFGISSNFTTTANTWVAAESYGASGGINLMANVGATWHITGVQLEKGSVATAFDYRPYGTELQLCQRYFVLLGTLFGGYTLTLGSGLSNGGTSGWRTSIKVPHVLRATPSITSINLSGWNPNISPQSLSSFGTIYALNGMCLEADLNYAGNVGTGGMPVHLQTNGSGGASYLNISAEL